MGPVIRNSFLGIIIVCVAGTRVSAPATVAPPPGAAKIPPSKIPRVHRAPQLEDFLEHHPREAELTVTDFRQNTPGDGAPATESTAAYLSYDDKNFYAVFVCHDEAGEVRAHLSKREASDQDDGVGILLDTFRDFHRAYFFYSNPLGVQTSSRKNCRCG
ncbi:MAG: rane associated hydrolase [Candidatus Acidoferrum typicum]|nr:rane associated hydrolase [Candidatus Acidoferrum typicum]